MKLRTLHRCSALLIAIFAVLHIANHLVALGGVEAHIATMAVLRKVYRLPLIEGALLLCIAFQIGSGLTLLVRGWKVRRGGIAWLQALSGAYLAFFLLVHVGAVLFGRAVFDLDTNFYYAAAGLHVPPIHLFFAPYYFLAVLALFTHLGCVAYWRCVGRAEAARRRILAVMMLVGGAVSLLIVLALAGAIQPVDVPAKYKSTFRQQCG